MKTTFREEVMDGMLEYRKKNFAVEVKPSSHPIEDGEICLSITTNGYQWQTFSLLKSEVDRVVEALRLSHRDASATEKTSKEK